MLQEKSKKNDDIFSKKAKKFDFEVFFRQKIPSFKQKLVLLQAI
jgi:hypothetical protein